MTFDFHPEAETEFLEAIAYYESCSPGPIASTSLRSCIFIGIRTTGSPDAEKINLSPFPFHLFPYYIQDNMEAKNNDPPMKR
jgi:hypothetical protein